MLGLPVLPEKNGDEYQILRILLNIVIDYRDQAKLSL